MKYLIVFLFCMSPICKTNGQNSDSLTFLILKIKTEWDYKKKTTFCSLNVEKGNSYADELYSLVTYQNVASQTDGVYDNPNKTETGQIFEKKFNYFINATEAINYLTKIGWYLDNVFNDVTTELESSTEINGVVYYPKIKSEPVYIFKKRVK